MAVPRRAKALFWFCSQPVSSSGVFPVFFLSKEETVKPSYKSLFVKEPHGVFGIGSAFCFVRPSPVDSSKGHSTIKT